MKEPHANIKGPRWEPWSIYKCIHGPTSTLFLSGSLKSGPTSTSSNFPLVLLVISTTRHIWDVTAVDSEDQQASTLCCTLLCVYVKGAIHEQLAGVKSGKGRASVYDWVYLCLCVCVLMCVYMCPHVCHSAAVPDINVVTTKRVFDFYQRVQIALEEDHLVVGSWLSSL